MPTYQYRCAECGQDLEVVQKFTDSALTECPACQGQLRKVFNAVGVVFKGSGFYSTDNRNGSKSATNGTKSSDSSNGSQDKSSTGSTSDSGSGASKDSTGSAAKTPAKAAAAD